MFENSNIIIDLGDIESNNEDVAFQKQKKKQTIKPKKPTGSLIIVDNFYNNAHEVRKYILTQEFSVRGNYPGQRTVSYATEELKNIILLLQIYEVYFFLYGNNLLRSCAFYS